MKAQHSKVTCERILYVPPLPAIMFGFHRTCYLYGGKGIRICKEMARNKGGSETGGGRKKGRGQLTWKKKSVVKSTKN